MDRKLITEVAKQFLLSVAISDKQIKQKLTFKEHIHLCKEILTLDYEGVATFFCEDIREFEGKFSKFLKYGLAGVAGATLGLKSRGLKVGLLKAPPLAMFALYLFRKFTDPCERACFRNIPLSTKRKRCRIECQVNAVRELVNELRSEIAKCRQFTNPEKCEKKLLKQYMKWSQRLQELLVKLRAIEAKEVEKTRKERGKELKKRAKLLAASINISPSKFTTLILENPVLRERLSFREHLYLYDAALKKKLNEDVTPPKTKPIAQKILNMGLVAAAAMFPSPMLVLALMHLNDLNAYKCSLRCSKAKNEKDKGYCYKKCKLAATRWTISYIHSELRKCSGSKNPKKCEKKLYKLLKKWQEREAAQVSVLKTYEKERGIK